MAWVAWLEYIGFREFRYPVDQTRSELFQTWIRILNKNTQIWIQYAKVIEDLLVNLVITKYKGTMYMNNRRQIMYIEPCHPLGH